MPIYTDINHRYMDWNEYTIKGQIYRTLNPKEMLTDFIVYDHELREWDLKVTYLVGTQGSGKTVYIRYFVDLIRSEYHGNVAVVATNDIRILGDSRYAYLFKGVDVIVLIIDDAIATGMDSRTSMHGVNIDITQIFAQTRHIMRDNFRPVGIIFMLFATQSFTRLDRTIREGALLKIFTDYYDEDFFQNLFTPDQTDFFREKCYDGMFKADFDKRRFALAKTRYGDVATLEIPFLSPEQVKYPIIDRYIDPDDLVEALKDLIVNDVPEYYNKSKSALKGFLRRKKKEYEKSYFIKIKRTHYIEAIELALWEADALLTQQDQDKTNKYNINWINPGVKDRIIMTFKSNPKQPIMHISEICRAIGEDSINVAPVLSQYKSLFRNIVRNKGYYCLREYPLSDIEIETVRGPSQKPMKILTM